MKLAERYVYAVTKNLPASQRDEVAKELRSDIQDMIENEQGAVKDRERKVLESLGDPSVLAQQYRTGKSYLIGPDWYSTYLTTLKRVSYISFPVAFAIHLIVSLMGSPVPGVVSMIIQATGSAIGVLIQVFFWVSLTFIILERASEHGGTTAESLRSQWSIDDLPELPPEREVKLIDSICGIIAYIAMAIGVALTSTVLGAKAANGDTIPFFNPELWSLWIPIILVLLIGLAIKEFVVIIMAKRIRLLAVAEIALNTALTGTFVGLYAAGILINPAFVTHVGSQIGAKIIETILLASIVVWVVSYFIELVSTIIRLIKNN